MLGKKKESKVKKRVLAMLLLFSIVPLCVFGAFSLYETSQKIDELTECNLKAISKNQIINIQKFAEGRKSAMSAIASYDLVVDAAQDSLDGKKKDQSGYLDNLLQQQVNHADYVVSVSVLDRGYHVVGSSEHYELNEISKMLILDDKYHTGEFIMGDVYERETDDGVKRVVPAYIGIYNEETLVGYVVEELDTTYFDELRLNMKSLSEGTFYLLDGTDTIITAGTKEDKTSLRKFVTTTKDRDEFHEKYSAIDHEKHPTGELVYHYGGDKYITYYSDVQYTEWSIRISENLSEQKRDMWSFVLWIVLMFFVLCVGAVVSEIFLTNHILHPIQNAIDMFEQIRQTQDYSLRMPVESQDELGKMAEGINELMDYVEEKHEQQKNAQQELQLQADSDPLTGVMNKRAFEAYAREKAEYAAEHGEQIVFGFLDVDDFKRFNTDYGHQQGDEILCYVAQTLQSLFPGEVGRIGGDEFVFCYVGEISGEQIRADANTVIKRLAEEYQSKTEDCHMAITGSLGVVTTKKSTDYIELVRCADLAMYRAKDQGKNIAVILEV